MVLKGTHALLTQYCASRHARGETASGPCCSLRGTQRAVLGSVRHPGVGLARGRHCRVLTRFTVLPEYSRRPLRAAHQTGECFTTPGRGRVTRCRAVCHRHHGVQSYCRHIWYLTQGYFGVLRAYSHGSVRAAPEYSLDSPRGQRRARRPQRSGAHAGVPPLSCGTMGYSQRTHGLLQGVLQEEWCISRTR